VLQQKKGWTYGILMNQIWSVAGDKDRDDVNQMYLQPFVTYNWKSGAGLTVNSETTFNWEANTTNAFINMMAGGLIKFGKQLVQLQVGPRLQVAAPDGSRSKFGVRAAMIFVFPKK
jgi:CubicO group peptidase (beta-lactamase class C family)